MEIQSQALTYIDTVKKWKTECIDKDDNQVIYNTQISMVCS
jgi:hypothetical protein